MAPFARLAEGVLALEEGDPAQAGQHLEQALSGMERFRHSSPLMGVMIDRAHSYLALACVAQGDQAAAEQHFRQAEPRLRALATMDDLLTRCEQALGPRAS
jgi:Tfp pilus assembly protein PilF